MLRWPITIAVLWFACSTVAAREFRALRRIPTPKRLLKKGDKPVSKIQPIDRKDLEAAVREAVASWNTKDLSDHLDGAFYDGERLVDSVAEKVPRDAKLRILAVRNVEILQQFRPARSTGSTKEALISVVTATMRTQIEYRDPKRGFQRIPGENEFLMRLEMERE